MNLTFNKTKLLITGGAGFIGHHLVEGVLKATDWEIVILDGLTYAGSLNRLTDISIWEKEKHRIKFVWHDLKAPISESVHRLIGEVDYIWHLAAESHVDRSLEDSIPFVITIQFQQLQIKIRQLQSQSRMLVVQEA